MKKSILALLIVGLILTGAIIGTALGLLYIKPPGDFDQGNPPTFPPSHPDPADRDRFMIIKGIITTINITLSVALMLIYVNIYRETKSEFTISLIIVTLALFLYALFSNPLLPMLFGYRLFGLGPFTMLPDMFTTVALIVLLYVSLK
jgi:hypothetical protein